MTDRIDATHAPTAPFTPTSHHELLATFAGAWAGITETWLDPAAPPESSRTEATIALLLGGRWLRIEQQGTVMGAPHAGVMILGFHKDAGAFESSWIDSFHTGSAIMTSTGAPGHERSVSLLGSYAAGDERWGWRTVLRRDGDELRIEAFNISPSGLEEKALATRLTRR